MQTHITYTIDLAAQRADLLHLAHGSPSGPVTISLRPNVETAPVVTAKAEVSQDGGTVLVRPSPTSGVEAFGYQRWLLGVNLQRPRGA